VCYSCAPIVPMLDGLATSAVSASRRCCTKSRDTRVVPRTFRRGDHDLAWREPRPPEEGRGRCHAWDSSKVSCGTSSLPLVSGLNSRVTTNAIAAAVVVTSIGTAKPSG
jgi:hypothetical protein